MALLKFDNICRLCLKQNEFMSSIFDNTNNKRGAELLVGQITTIAHVDICPKDGLPLTICHTCRNQVQQFYKFRLLVEVSDRTLRQYLKSNPTADDANVVNNCTKKVLVKKQFLICNPISTVLVPLSSIEAESWNPKIPNENTEVLKAESRLIDDSTNNEFVDNLNNTDDVCEEILSNKYCCELCSAKFNILDDLKNHVIEHCIVSREAPAPIQGSKEENYVPKQPIFSHKTNQPNNNKIRDVCMIKCETCLKPYSKTSIKRHILRCNWKQQEFVCDICGKIFNKKSELRYHKGAHLPSPLVCERCNKPFRNAQSYNIHMKRHTVGSRFSCETCGKRYYTNSELARHVQKHADKRKHPCHLCDTAFLSRPELNRHLKYHNGVKKFKCHICSKCYYESGHLKVHMRVHTGEKPFVCQCGKAFITKSKLIRHEKIHIKKNVNGVC